MGRSGGRGTDGFTLIEILVAFVILAIAMDVLLQSFSTGVMATGRYEAKRTALMLAQSTLSGLETQPVLAVSDTTGRFDNGFRWHILVQPYADGAHGDQAPLVAREVSVTVYWAVGTGEQALTLKTVRLAQRG